LRRCTRLGPAILVALFALPGPATAGSFNHVANCDDMLGCFPGVPKSDPSQTVPPFAITHPLADNNPVIVDATVIDEATYSRSVAANLPAGHTWAANGNRRVAESLGVPLTQAVMYGLTVPEHEYSGLSADDVNMVRMGIAGEDLMAGTKDDYTVELV